MDIRRKDIRLFRALDSIFELGRYGLCLTTLTHVSSDRTVSVATLVDLVIKKMELHAGRKADEVLKDLTIKRVKSLADKILAYETKGFKEYVYFVYLGCGEFRVDKVIHSEIFF